MTISISELAAHSCVITVDDVRINQFQKDFKSHGLFNCIPFYGNLVDRNSIEFKLNKHFIEAHKTHLEVVQMASNLHWPFVCIFEDDAYPCIDILNKLQYYLEDIPNTATILKLGSGPFTTIYDEDKKLPKFEKITEIEQQIHHYGGSHAYIVFKSFYAENAKMLKEYYKNIEQLSKTQPLIENAQYWTNNNYWFYEWLMCRHSFQHKLQHNVFTIQHNDNLFIQHQHLIDNSDIDKKLYQRKVFNIH